MIRANQQDLQRGSVFVLAWIDKRGRLRYNTPEETMKLVVTYPDYKALGIESFSQRILQVVPDAIVVPVLNGAPEWELQNAADGVKEPSRVFPVVEYNGKGLASTLGHGYRSISYYPLTRDRCVVRLDTTEHPVEEIPRLAQAAMDCGGMAIGDLVFDEYTLLTGSVDEFAHLDLFPTLFRETTRDRLAISCAHGFQALAPGRLTEVFHHASLIRRIVELKTGQRIEWGFDAAMALAAVGLGVPVTVCPVQATTVRNRPRDKIALQFQRALQMCLAARQFFPNLGE